MNHNFDIEHARDYGLPEAVLIANFQFWIGRNKANRENEREGRTWTYNSIKAFTELFPYLTTSQIRRALEKLVDLGVLLAGTFNANGADRTKWYAFNDECKFLKPQMHLPKTANAFGKGRKTVTKTDVNPDVNPDKTGAARSGVGDEPPAEKDFDPLAALLAEGVDEQTASDWMQVRKEHKAPLTATSLQQTKLEAQKAGMSMQAAVTECCARSWRGFKASWVAQTPPAGATFPSRADKAKNFADRLTGKKPPNDPFDNIIDINPRA